MSIFKSFSSHSFEKLIKNEQEKLYRVAYSYVRNEQDALDVVQESIIKGYKSFHKLQNTQYFSTWITRILINTAIDFLRRSKDVIMLEPDWIDTGLSEENAVIMAMDFEQVFDSLKPQQRTLLLLRFYHGYSISEIADILDKPKGTVKSQLHRTLYQVKGILEKGGFPYGEASRRY